MKIYTKTGDVGETSLFGGKRVLKSELRIDTYGTVDELNSYVGLIRDLLPMQATKEVLKAIQDRLFTIGATLASDPENAKIKVPDLKEEDIALLEQQIDSMEASLEPLKNFILPGGHPTVSHCHIARCVCRRAERLAVALHHDDFVHPLVIKYLNRLSDYLFVLSRFASKELNAEEITWEPRM